MPRTCTICRNLKVEAINAALIAGDSFRSIALRFGTSHMAVRRHKEHLPAKLVKAHEAKEVTQADVLLDQVRQLTDEARGILKSVKTKNPTTAVQAVRAALHALELQTKILGEIRQAQVNVGVAVAEPLKIIVRYVDPKSGRESDRSPYTSLWAERRAQERASWNELVPKLAAPTGRPYDASRTCSGAPQRAG